MKNNDNKTEDNNENIKDILMSDYLSNYGISLLENAGFKKYDDYLDVTVVAFNFLKGFGFLNTIDLLSYLKAINPSKVSKCFKTEHKQDMLIIIENILVRENYYDSNKIARMTIGDLMEITDLTEKHLNLTVELILEHYSVLFRLPFGFKIFNREDALNNADLIFTYKSAK